MKKILLPLILLGTVSAFSAETPSADPAVQAKANQQMKLQNKNVIKHVIDEISTKLPQTVDKYTTFTNISSEDLTLVYTYEINTGAKSDEAVKSEDGPRMEPYIKKGICQSSKRFLESDIAIKYVYKSAVSKNELFAFKVDKKDCKAVWQ